jgi:hypothetical protein
MERDQINSTLPILLPLHGADLPDVYDALIAHAVELDKDGDHVGAGRLMCVVDRIARMQGVELEVSRQSLLALGAGVARGRPQG